MIGLGQPEEHAENTGDNLRILCGHCLEYATHRLFAPNGTGWFTSTRTAGFMAYRGSQAPSVALPTSA